MQQQLQKSIITVPKHTRCCISHRTHNHCSKTKATATTPLNREKDRLLFCFNSPWSHAHHPTASKHSRTGPFHVWRTSKLQSIHLLGNAGVQGQTLHLSTQGAFYQGTQYMHEWRRAMSQYSGTPLLGTPWGPGEVSCIQWNPSIGDTLGTW